MRGNSSINAINSASRIGLPLTLIFHLPTIYGLTGTTSWRIDEKDIDVAPGETVFIKRGVVHGFTNRSAETATCLCTLSPGVLGPQYFKDMAQLLSAGAPDPAKMKETMLRYGLIPALPSSRHSLRRV
jgi:hypothetical protein